MLIWLLVILQGVSRRKLSSDFPLHFFLELVIMMPILNCCFLAWFMFLGPYFLVFSSMMAQQLFPSISEWVFCFLTLCLCLSPSWLLYCKERDCFFSIGNPATIISFSFSYLQIRSIFSDRSSGLVLKSVLSSFIAHLTGLIFSNPFLATIFSFTPRFFVSNSPVF